MRNRKNIENFENVCDFKSFQEKKKKGIMLSHDELLEEKELYEKKIELMDAVIEDQKKIIETCTKINELQKLVIEDNEKLIEAMKKKIENLKRKMKKDV